MLPKPQIGNARMLPKCSYLPSESDKEFRECSNALADGPSSGRSYIDGRVISQGRFDRLQAARFIQIAETSLLNVWGCMTTRAV